MVLLFPWTKYFSLKFYNCFVFSNMSDDDSYMFFWQVHDFFKERISLQYPLQTTNLDLFQQSREAHEVNSGMRNVKTFI